MQNGQSNISFSLAFLRDVITRRLDSFVKKDSGEAISYPELHLIEDNSPLSNFVFKCQPNVEEYVILLLALTPHLQPNLIDTVVQQYLPDGGDLPEIGGVKGNNHRGTLPTGETALFLLGGEDVTTRLHIATYFSADHFFAKENILHLEPVKNGEPRMSGKIILQQEYLDLFTTGTASKPSFGPDFPAKLITTRMEWEDLILNPKTAAQINDLKVWLQHNLVFMKDWEMDKKVKPGYRVLFHGPSGTGKTLTATLLGKQFAKDVYRIDLSQVVSKYIGETEKNLEKIFNKAEHKDWILFFDEADALFGKRSSVQNAHDRYANQEVSYLLQRVEDFPGLIILASNFKNNIDSAFIRRFNSIIHFPMPNQAERFLIWKTTIPNQAQLAQDADLQTFASFELSGSAILSAVHYASLQTINKSSTRISREDIIEGIKREYEKEDKVF